ncbi:hypothetical protein D3C86_2170310 [compost metagenome]
MIKSCVDASRLVVKSETGINKSFHFPSAISTTFPAADQSQNIFILVFTAEYSEILRYL